MVELTQDQLVYIAIACTVVILAAGLTVTLVVSKKNQAADKTKTDPVRPPVNPPGPLQPVKDLTCAPASPTASFTLVPCDKSGTCDGCKEYVDAGSAYTCVTVTGGSSGSSVVDSTGQLIDPLFVRFPTPLPPGAPQTCSGKGKLDEDGKCVCEEGYSGEACDTFLYRIATPGSYCLPAAVQSCNNATTESVLVNPNAGKAGKYQCACKPEYETLFRQEVEGGPCNVPLICGGNAVQMDKQGRQQEFAVGRKQPDGSVQFTNQPLILNRVTAAGATATTDCVAKVTPPVAGNEPESKPFMTATVDALADPRCKPVLYSNYCVAVADTFYSQAEQTSAATERNSAFVTIRGSGRPGDPLLTRAYPPFHPPVPPALKRCPDGYLGSNSPNDRCRDSQNRPLQFQASKVSLCATLPDKDPGTMDPSNPVEYETEWHDAVFTSAGEWNGYFTCVADLQTARVKLPNGDIKPVSELKWTTVVQSEEAPVTVSEVLCANTPDQKLLGPNGERYWVRSRTDQPFPTACADSACTGVDGKMALQWDGSTDNLLDSEGNPWFAQKPTDVKAPQPSYGGQCGCDGYMLRKGKGDALEETPMVAGYLNQNTGPDNYWQCLPDTCWTPQTPSAHLLRKDFGSVTPQPDMLFPQCVCNSGAGTKSPPYDTYMSYRPEGQTPTCVKDACNPDGFKTTTQITCSNTDKDCEGVCYQNKCYLPRSTQTCQTDSDCVNNAADARTTGKCDLNTKVCLYADPDRQDSFCSTSADCSYGVCSNVSTVALKLDKDGNFVPIRQGTCSGGCACSIESVQQTDMTNPLGFTCRRRCDVTPCVGAHTEGACFINLEPGDNYGKQVCNCQRYFTGPYCENSSEKSRKGGYCIPWNKMTDVQKNNASQPGYKGYNLCHDGLTCKLKTEYKTVMDPASHTANLVPVGEVGYCD